MENSDGQSSSAKLIPYYKKIVGTRFAVDAFNYDSTPEITYYFLSHFHYDHYMGLKSNFTGSIVTSPITGRLIVNQIGVKLNYVIMVDINQPIVIDGVTVVLIDASHCPGSVMFLFILPEGKRILHTGDFRASSEMEQNKYLIENPIDHIYLDTTYCHPDYNFPSQGETLQMVIDLTLKHLSMDPRLLIVCGAYTVGKEKVFKCLCETLYMNLWVSSPKLKLLQCINDSEILQHFVINKNEAQIHVLPMSDINHDFLKGYLNGCDNHFSSILAFKPSGWQKNIDPSSAIIPSARENIFIYGIPYSEHSSYSELERFVKFLKPRMITPTVIHSDTSSRVTMFKTLAQWKSTYLNSANGEQYNP